MKGFRLGFSGITFSEVFFGFLVIQVFRALCSFAYSNSFGRFETCAGRRLRPLIIFLDCQTTDLTLKTPLFEQRLFAPPLGLVVRVQTHQTEGGVFEPDGGRIFKCSPIF